MKCVYVITGCQEEDCWEMKSNMQNAEDLWKNVLSLERVLKKFFLKHVLCQLMISEDSHLVGCELHSRYEHQDSNKPAAVKVQCAENLQ